MVPRELALNNFGMNDTESVKESAKRQLSELIAKFRRNSADYVLPSYNETQARTEFITPLLGVFGWDVNNNAGSSAGLREVIEEATVEVGESRSKKPDYELRLSRQRKLFVEAKKPSVSLGRSKEAAFQIRRYGFSANLPISVLTNFHQISVYDCKHAPTESDEANVCRIMFVQLDDLEEKFEELWAIFSREAVYSGEFDKRFSVDRVTHGVEQFDQLFLRQVRSWRARLAMEIHSNGSEISPKELTYVVQLFLSRIIFLRICEDREIERYETLRALPQENKFSALLEELRRADGFYNSGLFRILDDEPLGAVIGDDVLHEIIEQLYYPQSPYTFSVVETEVLGQIYEQFLGEEISIDQNGVSITYKPEIREGDGVFPTPRYIVDVIVERTLGPMLFGRSPQDIANLSVADLCCGSGVFLLSVYEVLMEHYLNWYLANDPDLNVGQTIFESGPRKWQLTFEEKRSILTRHIRGVDIDGNAVEVAQFSLLLKLIEGESRDSLAQFVNRRRERALPDLSKNLKSGNSLVSRMEWANALGLEISDSLEEVLNPFDWSVEFPEEMAQGGFCAIVGNPPYIRIQNMANYSPDEVCYFKNEMSPYSTGHQDNFDKYSLFIERYLTLVRHGGAIGVIVPNKFMTIRSGRALRRVLTSTPIIESIVHFGSNQVFGRSATNYTCILILERSAPEVVKVERVKNVEGWRYGLPGVIASVPTSQFSEDPWQFFSEEAGDIFSRIRNECPNHLGTVAEIFVGVQTSADKTFVFRSQEETEEFQILRSDGRDWPIEKGILRPFLLDVKLEEYVRPITNSWLIFPYDFIARNGRPAAQLIQPEAMRERFPCCYDYLLARRGELEMRAISGGRAGETQFYQFGRSQSLVKFNSPKIILPALSTKSCYAYDDRNVVVGGGGNGPYYLLRSNPGFGVSDYYLLAVLNHPISEAFIRSKTSVFSGGYYSHGKQFIENLPVPIPSESDCNAIEALVFRTLEESERLKVARTPHDKTLLTRRVGDLKSQIQSKVTALFGLSEIEMDVMRSVSVEV